MNWLQLPFDLVGEIGAKLDTMEDISCFSCVCRIWNQVGSMLKSNWKAQVPYLLLEEKGDEPNNPRTIFNVTRNKCHKLYIPEIFGARCWGSAYGWLVVFGLDLRLYLLNPLTKAKITFPRFPLRKHREESDDEWLRTFLITKAIVIRDYENGDNFIVFIISDVTKRHLAFARPSDKKWTKVKSPFKDLHNVEDVTSLGSHIFILYEYGCLGYFDITKVHNKVRVQAMRYLSSQPNIVDIYAYGLIKFYLVEAHGDIFLVVRYTGLDDDDDDARDGSTNDDGLSEETSLLEVYKLNMKTKEWKITNTLGNLAFFIGNGSSMSIELSSAPNFKPNCIYYTDDNEIMWDDEAHGGDDMGCYNLETEEFCHVYNGDRVVCAYSVPLWLVPKF